MNCSELSPIAKRSVGSFFVFVFVCFHLKSYYENFFKQNFYFLVVEAGMYGITRNIVNLFYGVHMYAYSDVSVYPKLICLFTCYMDVSFLIHRTQDVLSLFSKVCVFTYYFCRLFRNKMIPWLRVSSWLVYELEKSEKVVNF